MLQKSDFENHLNKKPTLPFQDNHSVTVSILYRVSYTNLEAPWRIYDLDSLVTPVCTQITDALTAFQHLCGEESQIWGPLTAKKEKDEYRQKASEAGNIRRLV